jgi:hypothetical protein
MVTLPVAAGAKVTFFVTTRPGVMIYPLEMPEAVKPAPEVVTAATVMLTLPKLVKFTLRLLFLVTITLPKLKLPVLGVSPPGVAALTVSVAALLVTLLAELLTTTVNCAPVSEVVSAGVV